MNVDSMLTALNDFKVDYLLIGGINFLLRHEPVATFDVDIWIEADAANRARCEDALTALKAEWGRTEEAWESVSQKARGWLTGQSVFCVSTECGALDVFLAVKGLSSWSECRKRAHTGRTSCGTIYHGLSDEDMLACQLALEEGARKEQRIKALRAALNGG